MTSADFIDEMEDDDPLESASESASLADQEEVKEPIRSKKIPQNLSAQCISGLK